MDSRLILAGLCGVLQFVACLVAGLLLGLGPSSGDQSAWLLFAAPPALASALLLLVAILAPNVFAVGKLAFPLNLTLPIVHGSLMIVVTVMVLTMKVGVMAVPDRIAAFGVWSTPPVWLASVGAQIVVLSAAARLRRRADR